MEIRPARENEQQTIKQIVKQAGINPTALQWQRFLVGEDRGKIVAIGQVKPHGDGTRELASIAVVPERQGQGLGTMIVRALMERETEPLYLTCMSDQEGFYTRFGFRTLEFKEMSPYFRRISRIASVIMLVVTMFSKRKVRMLVMKE